MDWQSGFFYPDLPRLPRGANKPSSASPEPILHNQDNLTQQILRDIFIDQHEASRFHVKMVSALVNPVFKSILLFFLFIYPTFVAATFGTFSFFWLHVKVFLWESKEQSSLTSMSSFPLFIYIKCACQGIWSGFKILFKSWDLNGITKVRTWWMVYCKESKIFKIKSILWLV